MRLSWKSLKEKYARFRRWQREPKQYVKNEEEHHCCNCGFSFTGNYCPTCSQRASVGSIGWHSVRQSVMEVWGLGSRTIVNSVWQLLFRPGYFISDYISGKRQLSFPPMKMLFILAVAYAIVFHWLFPELKGLGYGMDFSQFGFTADEGRNMARMSEPFYEWYETHFGWSMLIISFMVIFPTWVMFHYSPRHTRHSLPEGFFIQVLFTDLQLGLFLLMLPCWFLFNQMTILTLFFIVVVAYFIIGYMQLFGYGFWGTLWRLAFVFCFVYSNVLLLGHFIFFTGEAPDIQVAGYSFPAKNFMTCFYVIGGILILSTGYLINWLVTPKARRQQC